jgi:hypothetical protein
MMPYINGYIKLHRKVLDGGWLQNGDLWRFWSWCLLKAAYEPYVAIVGYQKIPLNPGQFIFGRNVAVKELKMSERTIRTCLSTLKKLENLTIKPTNKFSIITVVNWELYQSNEDEATNKATNDRPTSDQQVTTFKEYKEGKEGKSKTKKTFSSDSIEIGLAEFYAKLIKGRGCEEKLPSSFQGWASDIDKLIRIDGRPPERIKEVMEWVQGDSFWQGNILCPSKLRNQWGKVTDRMKGVKTGPSDWFVNSCPVRK